MDTAAGMSQLNVDTVLRCYAAYNAQDWDGAVADFHPEATYRVAAALDRPLLHEGREAIRAFFAEAADDWEGDVSEPQETFDLGDQVLVRVVERWTGRNGIATEMSGAQLWKLDPEGRITSFESFDDLDDARAAADTQT